MSRISCGGSSTNGSGWRGDITHREVFLLTLKEIYKKKQSFDDYLVIPAVCMTLAVDLDEVGRLENPRHTRCKSVS